MIELLLILSSGFAIGIIGSFHCVGMCGPLAIALPIHNLSQFRKFLSTIFYNLGRAISYISIGIFFGALGQSINLFNFQQFLSILSGLLILLILLGKRIQIGNKVHIFSKITTRLKLKLSQYLRDDSKTINFLYIGILNGLLPCGLVYIAVISSMATANIYYSALLMLAFGMGTLPIMVFIMYFGNLLSIPIRKKLNKTTPYLIVCVSLLLIVRGLNLGIPYISPSHDANHTSCCSK